MSSDKKFKEYYFKTPPTNHEEVITALNISSSVGWGIMYTAVGGWCILRMGNVFMDGIDGMDDLYDELVDILHTPSKQ